MKIGVLTLPLYVNYGGILQAWALQTVLERMGHKAEVIIIKGKITGRLKSIRPYLSPIKRFLLNIIPLVKDKHIQQDVYCRTFIKKHIKSHCFEDFDSISNNQYDAIVVGSDQIWREKYFKAAFSCPINNAFLSFISGGHVKKISFAASFGLEEWQWNIDQTEEIKKFLEEFNAISVREYSAVDLLKKYASCNASHVLDPTLLLDAKDYMTLFRPKAFTSKRLMTYILDETDQKLMLVENISKKLHLDVFKSNNNHLYDAQLPIKERIQPPVEEWLNGFYESEFIITDSFHACVFSILFNKPFIAIGNRDRGLSRFYSLLNMFGQEFRLYTDIFDVELTGQILSKPNCDVASARKESLDFLKCNL